MNDRRYINEIHQIRKNGGKIVLVKRTEIPNKKTMIESGAHQSEWDWIGTDYDYILENTHTIESLHKQIYDMTTHLVPGPQ